MPISLHIKIMHTLKSLRNHRIQTTTPTNEKRVGGTWFGGFESLECPAPEGFGSSGGFGGAGVLEAQRFSKSGGFRGAEVSKERRFSRRGGF